MELLKTIFLFLTQGWVLIGILGIFWTLAYLLVVIRAQLDKYYAIPASAMYLNLAWEIIFIFIYPFSGFIYLAVFACLLLDLLILGQFIYFGHREFSLIPRPWFIVGSLLLVPAIFGLVMLEISLFDDFRGIKFGFVICAIISIGYILLLNRRRALDGLSIWSALARIIGTFAIYFYAYRIFHPWFIHPVYLIIFISDLIFVIRLRQTAKKLGINVWQRL